jgi:hypothetical protein
MLRNLLIIVLVFSSIASIAQKKKKDKKDAGSSGQPSSLAPYYPQKDYEPTKKKKPSGKVTYDARDKYYDRLEEIAKQEKKNEKLSEKPQYSDPMYFGHKRPPKKRPAHKMKYCKVCGIRH